MNGLYLDRKAVKLFVILLAVTVVASIGIAAVSHVYFGHETEGKATEFNEGLTLGSSFSLEDIIKEIHELEADRLAHEEAEREAERIIAEQEARRKEEEKAPKKERKGLFGLFNRHS